MNRMWFLLFTVLPLAAYTYILWHIWCILPFSQIWKWLVLVLVLVCMVLSFSYFIFSLDNKPFSLSVVLYEVGNSTLFIALYAVMLFLLLDICRLVRLVPKSFLYNSLPGTLVVTGILAALFIYGYVHYNNKVRVPMEIKNNITLKEPVRIVVLSDLHIGYHNRKDELERWIGLINREHADFVLICGDIIDGSIRAVREQKMEDVLRKIEVPVYAILGNHEYYAGKEESVKFYHDAGICLLVDSVAKVGDITLIGRDDRTNIRRKSLNQLMQETGPDTGFTILMDHQPYHLEEAEHANICLQLSGHTHYGQVWPISWIEDAIYEDAFGLLTKGSTQYYVTSGIGIWGGKFRIGTRSEYVVIEINS